MWRTEVGNRVLIGAEAELFREGLTSLIDWVEDDRDHEVGVRVFDRLVLPEKLAVLEQVARALLVKRVPLPRHTAVNEGAIAAVYYQLLIDLEVEIDEGGKDVRRLIRRACESCDLAEALPSLRSQELHEWRDAVDGLMFRILWDCDWEVEPVEPDDPPDKANAIREFMGVDEDYYTAVPPDPNATQLAKIRSSLRRLCQVRVRDRA